MGDNLVEICPCFSFYNYLIQPLNKNICYFYGKFLTAFVSLGTGEKKIWKKKKKADINTIAVNRLLGVLWADQKAGTWTLEMAPVLD